MDELCGGGVTRKMGLCFARKSTGARRGEGVVCGVWEIACLISFKRGEVIGWRNGKRCDGCVYKTFGKRFSYSYCIISYLVGHLPSAAAM